MKTILLSLLIMSTGCMTYEYQVHLTSDDNGTHHLINARTEKEAQDFIKSYEADHGPMKIIKNPK